MSPRRKHSRAFTMVEMMFAVMILAIVLLALISVLGSVLRSQYNGREYDKISIAASTLFGKAGQALDEHFDRPLVPDIFPDGRQPVPNLDGVSYEIAETQERSDLARVDLTLYWKDKDGNEHQKVMSTKFLRAH